MTLLRRLEGEYETVNDCTAYSELYVMSCHVQIFSMLSLFFFFLQNRQAQFHLHVNQGTYIELITNSMEQRPS